MSKIFHFSSKIEHIQMKHIDNSWRLIKNEQFLSTCSIRNCSSFEDKRSFVNLVISIYLQKFSNYSVFFSLKWKNNEIFPFLLRITSSFSFFLQSSRRFEIQSLQLNKRSFLVKIKLPKVSSFKQILKEGFALFKFFQILYFSSKLFRMLFLKFIFFIYKDLISTKPVQ